MFYLLSASIIWAFSFGLIKGQLTNIDSSFVSFLRLFLSFIVFLPFFKNSFKNNKLKLQLLLIGAVEFGLMYICYIKAYSFLKAYEIAFFTITTPFFVILINNLFCKRYNLISFLWVLVSIIGTALILYSGIETIDFWKGFILIQFSNLTFALGQVMYRNLSKKHNLTDDKSIFAILYLGAVIVTGISSVINTDFASIHLTMTQVLIILYLGIVPSGICFFMWNIGSVKANIVTLSIFNNIKIPLAILVSIIIFGERTSLLKLFIGSLIILISIVVSERRK